MTSLFLAKLIGVAVLVKAIALFAKKKECASVVGEFMDNKALIYFVGMLEMIGGLAIVLVHNVWTGGWPVIITVIGWLMLIEGIAVAILPLRKMVGFYKGLTSGGWLTFWGIVALIVGLYLSYVGFFAGY